MKTILWSFYGYLNSNNRPTDTPDGAGYTRPVILNSLINNNYYVMCANPMLDTCNINMSHISYVSQNDLLYAIKKSNIILIEWRWYRHNYDNSLYYRQVKLINLIRYANCQHKTIIWDKDLQITHKDKKELMDLNIASPSLQKRLLIDKYSLQFPLSLQDFEPDPNMRIKDIDLCYIGNEYDRAKLAYKYFYKSNYKIELFGKWFTYDDKNIKRILSNNNLLYFNRINYVHISDLYNRAYTTLLLAPNRYLKFGHITQRLFEALINNCIPLLPDEYCESVKKYYPKEFIVNTTTINKTIETIKSYSRIEYTIALNKFMPLLSFYDDDIVNKLEYMVK